MLMILVILVVYLWLICKGFWIFCSVNVCLVECIDLYYFVVLIGCGVIIVNVYLVQDSFVDCIECGLLDVLLIEVVVCYCVLIDGGLFKIMLKMGILVLLFYCGGLNFEVVGLLCVMCVEYFFGMYS